MFKSLAHKEKLAELVKQGKVSKADFARMEKATGKKKLPERLTPRKK